MAVICEKFHRLLKKLGFKNVDDGGNSEVLKNGDSKQSSIPKGFIPVYVGEDRKRYLVPTAAANSPAFIAMLDKYEDDISRFGPLSLPCSAEAFEHALRRARDQTEGKDFVLVGT